MKTVGVIFVMVLVVAAMIAGALFGEEAPRIIWLGLVDLMRWLSHATLSG